MTSRLITDRCIPDSYLSKERVELLFEDFTRLQSAPSEVLFTSLVNSVRQVYLTQILHLQQELLSRSTAALETQHHQLARKHKLEIDELTHCHTSQLRDLHLNCEKEQERARVVTCTPSKWLVGIDVVYGEQHSQKPPNGIKDLLGNAECINDQQGGKWVWLVPRFTTDPAAALTRVDIKVQDHQDDSKRSLARGASGPYRYLVLQTGTDENKIYSINLLRLGKDLVGAPDGYDGATGNINSGRKGWLYLVWKSRSVK